MPDVTPEILKQGLLGALLLGALGVAGVLYRRGNTLQDAVSGAWKEVGQLTRDISVVLANLTTSNDARTRALEASVQSQQLLAASVANLATSVGALKDEQSEIRSKLENVERALSQRGVKL